MLKFIFTSGGNEPKNNELLLIELLELVSIIHKSNIQTANIRPKKAWNST